jgi:hypothetical protein
MHVGHDGAAGGFERQRVVLAPFPFPPGRPYLAIAIRILLAPLLIRNSVFAAAFSAAL